MMESLRLNLSYVGAWKFYNALQMSDMLIDQFTEFLREKYNIIFFKRVHWNLKPHQS